MEGMGDAGGRGKLVVMEDVKGGGARDSGWSASSVTYKGREKRYYRCKLTHPLDTHDHETLKGRRHI